MMQGGTNLPRIRDYNQGVVLEAVRTREGASRIEIAEKTGLTPQTVSNIVRRLLDEGLIIEAGVGTSSGGKPRVQLRINPDARYAVGVLVDRDAASLVVMALDGRIMARSGCPLHQEEGPEGVIAQLVKAINGLVEQARIDQTKILGIGVGYPGPMDHESGVLYEPFDLLGWGQVPLKEALQQRTGYSVVVDNDATATAIGERWVGGAQGAENFALIFMGMGVGAGLYIQSQIYRGSTTNAGEFGHMSINLSGPECFCGNRGCIEVYCSPAALIKAVKARLAQGEPSSLQDLDPACLDLDAICDAALEEDQVALGALQQSAQILAAGVLNLVSLLDLELVVLGGKALREVGFIYQSAVHKALHERLITRNVRQIRVELSAAGADAGAVGAAALVLHKIYSPRLTGLGAGADPVKNII